MMPDGSVQDPIKWLRIPPPDLCVLPLQCDQYDTIKNIPKWERIR